MLVEITNSDNAGKVFSPVRCKGDNLLRKRHFDKVRENGRNIYKYSGRAAVVVTSTTPIIFLLQYEAGEADHSILCAKVRQGRFLFGRYPSSTIK